MKEYVVLHDGREVASMRNPGKGKTIKLNAAQAEHPLRTGHIALREEKPAEKPKGAK